MWAFAGRSNSSGEMDWTIADISLSDPKEGATITFTFPKSEKRPKEADVLRSLSLVLKNNCPWISPIPNNWIVDLDQFQVEFTALPRMTWFTGRVFLTPEFNVEEELVPDYRRPFIEFQASVSFRITAESPRTIRPESNQNNIFIENSTIQQVAAGHTIEQTIRQQDEKAAKEERQIVRELVSAEIDYDLASLRAFWEKLHERDTDWDILNQGEKFSRKLADVSAPLLSHKFWDNQIPLLPNALKREQINAALSFHQKLELLMALQARLVELVKLDGENYQQYLDSERAHRANLIPTDFQRKAFPIWTEFERLVNELLNKGNPLQW